jgi:hypothetical protein
MEYSFNDDSPRFALNTLWFLLGVIVFAFSVLVTTAIVSGDQEGGYYLNVHQPAPQETKPVTGTNRTVTTTGAASGPARSTR